MMKIIPTIKDWIITHKLMYIFWLEKRNSRQRDRIEKMLADAASYIGQHL